MFDDNTGVTITVHSQTWSVSSGESLAVISGYGLGVKPVIFFQDSYKLASAQETGILVGYTNTLQVSIQVYEESIFRYGILRQVMK